MDNAKKLDNIIFSQNVSFFRKGEVFFEKKNYEKSIYYYSEAIKLFPQEDIFEYLGAEKLFFSLAQVYHKINELDKAKMYYDKSLNCITNNYAGQSVFNLGKIYFKKDELKKAKLYFLLSFLASEKKCFYQEDIRYYKLITDVIDPDFLKIDKSIIPNNKHDDYYNASKNLSLLGSFFKHEKIFSPISYQTVYDVEIDENLIGKQSSKIIFKKNTKQKLYWEQIVKENIFSKIEFEMENKEFSNLNFLNNFPKNITIIRDYKTGAASFVENKKEIYTSFFNWIEKNINLHFITLEEQETCFNFYLSLCKNLDYLIKDLPIYWMLFPSLYECKPYLSAKDKYILNKTKIYSALTGKTLQANLILKTIISENNYTIIQGDVYFEKESKEFLLKNKLNFTIKFTYKLKNISGEILSADLVIIERNKHKEYSCSISIKPNHLISNNNLIYKTHKGKTFTQEEWVAFEQKQFEQYAQKHNIPLEEEKPKKSFGFFLDEKDCKY